MRTVSLIRPLALRVTYLFNSGTSSYKRHPELLELIPLELYERGRHLAARLAESVPRTVHLHGDVTPSNILDGGVQRGLVAIDPAPCLGDDLAFDAIDLVLWQAHGVDTIAARSQFAGSGNRRGRQQPIRVVRRVRGHDRVGVDGVTQRLPRPSPDTRGARGSRPEGLSRAPIGLRE